MGTRFELVLHGGGRLGRRALEAAGEAALDTIHETEARWSLFLPTSRLARLNKTGHLEPLCLAGDDLALFKTIDEVHRQSLGAFDPNVAHAMARAGHFASASRTAQLGPASSTGTQEPRWSLDAEKRTVAFSAPGPSLDLGGVAKGHALDLAALELEDLGVTSALLHGGTSSVRALGPPPDQRGWRLALGAHTIELAHMSLASSKASAQLAGREGHIQIPGASAAPPDREAAVLAPTAALADAWATALVVRPTLAQEAAPALRAAGVQLLPTPSV